MKKQYRGIAIYVVIVLILLLGYRYFFGQINMDDQYSYEQFVSALEKE